MKFLVENWPAIIAIIAVIAAAASFIYNFVKLPHSAQIAKVKEWLLWAVAEAEKIEVTKEEADKDAEEMAKNYGISKEELIKAYGSEEVIMYDSKMRKTLDFLKNNN